MTFPAASVMSLAGIRREQAMITRSIYRIILPGAMLWYLATIRATISVPPVLPPCEKLMPIPRPLRTPPNMAERSFPLEIAISSMKSWGMNAGTNWKKSVAATMA